MSSAICFILDQPKSLSFGYGLIGIGCFFSKTDIYDKAAENDKQDKTACVCGLV